MYSSSLNNLFNYGSGSISYATVIESNGENFEGAAVQTKFYAGSDARPVVWWGKEILGAPLSNQSSPLNGKISEETVYKKAVSGAPFPIKKTQYVYTIDDRSQIKIYGYNVNKKYAIVEPVPGLPCGNNAELVSDHLINAFDVMRYDINSWWAHLTSQTETLYDENGANPVTSTTNLFYDNEQHLQLTRSETLNSKSELLKNTNTYPADYPGNPVYSAMIAKNIITPVITSGTSKTFNAITTELFKDIINYSNAGNNNFVPVSVQKSIKGGVPQTEGTIDQYDASGNVLQMTGKDGIVSAILWGYNYQYPVAQVIGSTYANAISQLSVTVAALQQLDGALLRAELNRIRTNVPAARVTSYTYKLMTGVTSITDPNNKTNTYDYDSFNRLLGIKDQDGNVVKKLEYVYATPDANALLNIFFSQPLTKTYQCQTCAAGYAAVPLQFNIPNGKYFSLLSQIDADAKAAADIEGQEYVNKTSKCISNTPCTNCTNFTPNWQNTTSALRCQLNTGGQYTGYQEQEQKDINVCSPTYNQTQWVVTAQNTTACPPSVAPNLTSTNTTGVAGYTASYYNTVTGVTYAFNVSSAAGLQTLGSIPDGTYNLTLSKPGNQNTAIFKSGCGKFQIITGLSAVFSNISVSASGCNSIRIDPDI
jgi:YD repeat-containing protein